MSEKAFEITKSDLHKVFWRSMPIEIDPFCNISC